MEDTAIAAVIENQFLAFIEQQRLTAGGVTEFKVVAVVATFFQRDAKFVGNSFQFLKLELPRRAIAVAEDLIVGAHLGEALGREAQHRGRLVHRNQV